MSPQRRVRPTLRCLDEDLHIALPDLHVDIGTLPHPMLERVREIAPTSPAGQKRVLAIDRPLVYRIRVGDDRGATWVDGDHDVVWLCAVHRREQGSERDAYASFEQLHHDNKLLPGPDDYLRDRAEAAIRFQRGLTEDLLGRLDDALIHPGAEVRAELGGWMPARLLVLETALTEVWCALGVVGNDGAGVPERIRNLLFAALEQQLAPTLSEVRADWPSGPIDWSEVVRLYLRERE